MKRPYLLLFTAVVVVAVVLVVLQRRPRGGSTPSGAPAVADTVALALEIKGGAVLPAAAAVPKGRRVRLTVVNRDPGPVNLGLTGYEDLLPAHTLAPGETWRAEFLADRPGDDFAWMVNGQPAARLSVAGSHLVEGHR